MRGPKVRGINLSSAENVSNASGFLSAGGLRRAQQIHALAIVLLPLVGAGFAVSRVTRVGMEPWQLVLCGITYAATMLGISVGFHRHLAHRAFDARPVVRAALIAIGSAAAQGPPLYWVANHRRHHRFSDVEGDPHSPNLYGRGLWRAFIGLWHAHVSWMFTHDLTNPLVYAKDLMRDRLLVRVNQLYWVWVASGIVLPAAVGALVTRGVEGALNGVLWGGAVRLFLSFHFTSCINSVTHAIGTRCFDTPDQSRNVSWLALPTVGEAWHNNHHAYPTSAGFGLRWWQFDPGGWLVNALRAMGLIWNVRAKLAAVAKP